MPAVRVRQVFQVSQKVQNAEREKGREEAQDESAGESQEAENAKQNPR